MTSHRIIAAAAALAVAAAPAALAKKPADAGPKNGPKAGKMDKGKGHTKAKNVVLKGVVVSSDATTVTVSVAKATKHGKALVGTDARFTITKLRVADTNADGTVDGSDLVAGDKVVVQARLAADGAGPHTARKVVDQTHPAPEDEQETETEVAPDPVVS